MSLYKLPDGTDKYVDASMLRRFATPPPTYYLRHGKDMYPIPRAGFKRFMRDFMSNSNPNLASRIGRKGYRYKDIANIVAEYNVTSGRRRRRL